MATGKEVAESTYSLAVLPEAGDPIVEKEKVRLLGSIDLEALVDDLGRLGNCVRIAYHSVAGFTDLQIEIQRIGYDVTRLCDKSAVTIGKFKNASATVLSSLKATYEFLLDNFEDMGLDSLADVADTAKGMAIAAEELRRDFESQANKVIEALERTQQTQDTEDKKKKKLEEERREMEGKKAKQEKLQEEALKAQENAEYLAREADAKENQAIQTIMDIKKEERRRDEDTGFWRKIINAFTGQSGRNTATLTASLRTSEEKARAAREEKLKYLEIKRQQQEMRSRALAALAEYMKKIENLKSDENQVEMAIDALQKAIEALKSLAAIMMQAALFWQQLQAHCEFLAKEEMKKMIEKALQYPEPRRLKFWNSSGFKNKAVQYYAGWVALDNVCGIYMERIKLTQRELYTYIQEALRPDDARKKVKELAKDFAADLAQQQKAIAERKAAQSKEIQDIKDEFEAKKAADEEAAKKVLQDTDRKQE